MDNSGLITLEYVKNIIKERPTEIHKGQCGRVLIIAGSFGMAGAAVLSVGGALRSGAGLVKAAIPKDIFNILQTSVPQATCMDISEGFPEGSLDIYDAVAIGPGLGVDEKKYLLIKDILKRYKGTVILDADGINCICKYDAGLMCLAERAYPVILTPHPGEGERLLGALKEKSLKELGRLSAAEKISGKTGSVVIMKGAGTIVATDKQKSYINTTGNAGMATGGSGDILTGVIAALAASGINAYDAAKAGVFMHGLAGDIAAERYGQWGMTALEITDALPEAFKQVVGK